MKYLCVFFSLWLWVVGQFDEDERDSETSPVVIETSWEILRKFGYDYFRDARLRLWLNLRTLQRTRIRNDKVSW